MSSEGPLTGGEETFRDSIATVDKQGKRIWIYPKKPSGQWFGRRALLGYLLLVLLFAGPFIRISGEPLLQFDVLGRRFVIFGQIFWPQDIHLFVLTFIAGIIFIALFTVAFGRLFCGWVCPQTIFMELVYRRIEYWIEGDWKQQQALNKAPWTTSKIGKKTVKHVLFFAIAFLIGNTFLAYIIGIDALKAIVTEPPWTHPGGFVAMVAFSFMFYGVFAFLREQVCTTICPYGRLQGVLLDRHSMVIAYDRSRGEQRARFRKGEDRAAASKGDCIDCKACVHVCPTGIDIRNGTQLECVNCTACIDACDEVMDKVSRPRGLIRYDSHNGIVEKRRRIFTPRVIAYSVFLAVLLALNFAFLGSRTEVEAIILRTPGLLFQKVDEDHVSNLYNFEVVNKTTQDMPIEFRLLNEGGEIKLVGQAPTAKAGEVAKGTMFIVMENDKIDGRKNDMHIEVYSNGKLVDKVKTNFFGPQR